MATARRRKKPSVIDRLLHNPEQFDFFQAVRLLERLAASEFERDSEVACENIGFDHPAALEAVRFVADHQLRFPDRDILKLESGSTVYNNKERVQFLLTVTLMRLTGSTGVLPFHYAEIIMKRARFKDTALKAFLDIFNHRALSLYYRAANKYRFAFNVEQQAIDNQREHYVTLYQRKNAFLDADLFTETLRSLAGINAPAGQRRLRYLNDNLLCYAAHFAQQPRNASNLARMLSDYFNLPVRVEQFLPQKQDIMPDMLTQLPSRQQRLGQNAQLGVNTIAGHTIWSVQAKFRLHMAPINYLQYESLAPGSPKLAALHELVRLYVGLDLDYDIALQIPARELPPARLRKDAPLPLQLGWNGFLPSRQDQQRMVTIRLAAPDIN